MKPTMGDVRMHFSIACRDKPGALPLRQANRPDHLAYLEAAGAALCLAGPLLDGEGQPIGSLLLIDVADRTAAEAFADDDPYAKAGVFAEVTITAFRPVLGEWVKVHG
jgi:uncharacterized protein YciI